MIASRILYAIGVIFAALLGFFSPIWYLGFAPLAAGCVWAAYDLVNVEEPDGKSQGTPTRGT